MYLIAIPYWANWVIVEMDRTIWAHRYSERETEMKGFTISETNGEILMMGKTDEHIRAGSIKLNAILQEEPRYLRTSDLEICVASGQTYKEFTFEIFMLAQADGPQKKQ